MNAARGLCFCGCGQPTKLAKGNNRRRGDVKGQPQRFIYGHVARLSPAKLVLRSARFESLIERIPEAGCWLWMGSIGWNGYGQFGRGHIGAHRVSWELHVGPIPPGMFVCHRCDVPSCVNPAHLFLGSSADNSRDMVLKGRSGRGERAGHAKLTSEAVLAIRASAQRGVALARRFSVSPMTISLIRSRQTWRHLP